MTSKGLDKFGKKTCVIHESHLSAKVKKKHMSLHTYNFVEYFHASIHMIHVYKDEMRK